MSSISRSLSELPKPGARATLPDMPHDLSIGLEQSFTPAEIRRTRQHAPARRAMTIDAVALIEFLAIEKIGCLGGWRPASQQQ